MREKNVSTLVLALDYKFQDFFSWNIIRIDITVWDYDDGIDSEDDILGRLVIDIRTLPPKADVWYDLLPKDEEPGQTSPGKIHLIIELDGGKSDQELPIYDQETVFCIFEILWMRNFSKLPPEWCCLLPFIEMLKSTFVFNNVWFGIIKKLIQITKITKEWVFEKSHTDTDLSFGPLKSLNYGLWSWYKSM